MNMAVIGAGSWGTTVAALAARRQPVTLWARRPELADAINHGENPDYLAGFRLPYGLRASTGLEATAKDSSAEALDQPWGQMSIEQLLVSQPDIILLGDAAYGVTPESVAARTGWDSLTAVTEGQMFVFDDNLVSRPGPRLVDGLEVLTEILHPGLLSK